ncbi:MAG: sortase [Bacilli bacterium]|nr:sortase [Bacilli bacterium]
MYTRMVKKLNNKRTKRISPNLTAVIGSLVIMIGGFFLSYNYIQTMKVETYDSMAKLIYKEEDNKAEVVEEKETKKEETGSKEDITNEVNETYIGYLSIPKINLKKGFFREDSKENDVEKNIYIVKGSSYPDVEKGNFIIAAHSGTGWKAFFNDLYKLVIGDNVIVTYNEKEYTYNIKKIYKQEKTGTIAIYRNYNETTLTLVTCTNNDSKTQTVYIAELTEVK